MQEKEIIIFDSSSGKVSLNADFKNDTIWATQEQISALFGLDRTGITRHIRNIYKSEELSEKEVSAKIAQVQNEGGRHIKP